MNIQINQAKAILNITAIDFSDKHDINFIKPLVFSTAEQLVNFLPRGQYVLYIRDIKDYSIDDKYPAGHTYNNYESMIAVPSWACNENWIKLTIAHELHHLVRWQHAGYGRALGQAILTEGLATYYESIIADWTPPWVGAKLSQSIIEKVRNEWDHSNYSHFDCFFEGEMGRWIGYTVGYKIVKQIYKDKFDLAQSFKIKLDDFNVRLMLDKVI